MGSPKATSYAPAGTAGNYLAGDAQATFMPKVVGARGDGQRLGVLLCHGAGGSAMSALASPATAQFGLCQRIGEMFPTVAGDFGGPQTWGNDAAMAAMDAAYAWQQANQGVRAGKVLVVGGSMGTLTALNWTKRNRAKVVAVATYLTCADLDDMWTNNRIGATSLIDAAYPPGYSVAVNGPQRSPVVFAAAGDLAGLPYLGFYATDDTVTLPAPVVALGAAIGSTATVVSTGASGGHADSSIAALDVDRIIKFLSSF